MVALNSFATQTTKTCWQDHVSFQDSMFDSVGGQLSAVMGKLGSSMVSTSGLGLFSGSSTSAGFSKPQSPDGANSSPEKPKPGKGGAAGKAWDAQTQCLKLQSEIEEKVESYQSKVVKCTASKLSATLCVHSSDCCLEERRLPLVHRSHCSHCSPSSIQSQM